MVKARPPSRKSAGAAKDERRPKRKVEVGGSDVVKARKTSNAVVRENGEKDQTRARKGPRKRATTAGTDDKKSNKPKMGFKKKRKREITLLYRDLTNPGGGDRKAGELVSDILEVLKDRAATLEQYCSTRIGSRVIQACLKWGSHDQRRQLLSSLKEQLPKLALDKHGHVVVLKLLRYATRTAAARKPTEAEKKAAAKNLKDLLEAFHGKNLHSAFYSKNGCRVINGFYFSEALSTKEKRRMLHEVAVPATVALTRPELPGSRTLQAMLRADSDLTEDHRKTFMDHLSEALQRCVDKELLGIDLVHMLFQAFCENAREEQLRELADKCFGGAPYLLSSKPGAEALLRLLGVASAKQRKAFCRDVKGKFVALTNNPVDYLVMVRLATTVDDTVLLTKTMFAEWVADLDTIVEDKYGHKVLAWLLRPDDPHIFSPYERSCIALPCPTSLKAADARRMELVRALRPPLRKALLARPLELAANVNAKSLLLAYLTDSWDAELVEALVAAGEKEAPKDDDLGLLGSGTSTTTLIALLKLEPASSDGALAEPLWRRCFLPRLVHASTSRCAFVLLALLKREGGVREAVLSSLNKQKAAIEAAAQAAEAKGKTVNGARKLLAAAAEAKKAK